MTNLFRTMAVSAVVVALSVRAEEHPLPPGYAALAYIESTGNQYIDTGVPAKPTTAVTMDCTVMSFAGQDVFFSSGYNNNDGLPAASSRMARCV